MLNVTIGVLVCIMPILFSGICSITKQEPHHWGICLACLEHSVKVKTEEMLLREELGTGDEEFGSALDFVVNFLTHYPLRKTEKHFSGSQRPLSLVTLASAGGLIPLVK